MTQAEGGIDRAVSPEMGHVPRTNVSSPLQEIVGQATGTVTDTLTAAARSVHSLYEAELQQQQANKDVVHDLMRCVAENHELILAQRTEMAKMRVTVQEASSFTRADECTILERLSALEDKVAQLFTVISSQAGRSTDHSTGRDELRALRLKLQTLDEQQTKTTAELGRAWGYIMADEAAEDCVEAAFGTQNPDAHPVARASSPQDPAVDEDKMLASLIAKSRLVSDTQTASRIKEGMSTLQGVLSPKHALFRWFSWASERVEARRAREAEHQSKSSVAMKAVAEQELQAPERIAKAAATTSGSIDKIEAANAEMLHHPKRSRSKTKALFKQKAKSVGKLALLTTQQHAVHEDKLEEKVSRKLNTKRLQQQLASDVSWLLERVPKIIEELSVFKSQMVNEQSQQDQAISRLATAQDALKSTVDSAAAATAGLHTALKQNSSSIRQPESNNNSSDKCNGNLRTRVTALENQWNELKDEGSLKELRKHIDDHETKLAMLVADKVSHDDLVLATQKLLNKTDSLMTSLSTTKSELFSDLTSLSTRVDNKLDGVGAALSEKVDSLFMKELEQSLRLELERLARVGGKAISAEALEVRLASLRATMQAEIQKEKDTVTGAAAFKCLLCDRPLPPKEEWKIVSNTSVDSRHSPSISHDHSETVAARANAEMDKCGTRAGSPQRFGPPVVRQGGPAVLDSSGSSNEEMHWEPQVVYRAGFPTFNRAVMRPMISGGTGTSIELGHGIGLGVRNTSSSGFDAMASSWGGQRSIHEVLHCDTSAGDRASSPVNHGFSPSRVFNLKRSGEGPRMLPGLDSQDKTTVARGARGRANTNAHSVS